MFRALPLVSTLLAAAAAMIAAAPATAAEFGDARSMSVRHGDLDLSTDRGVAVLNKRIAVAARSVCGTFHAADLAAKQRALACRTQSIADAAPNVEIAVAAARGGAQLAGNIAVGPRRSLIDGAY